MGVSKFFFKSVGGDSLQVLGGYNRYCLVKWLALLNHLGDTNSKIFFVSPKNFYININSLNLAMFGLEAFNKFFFFLFNITWVKTDRQAKKFLFLLKYLSAKVVFFFDPKIFKWISFFRKNFFLTSGLVPVKDTNFAMDYPLFVKNLTFYTIYLTYLLLSKFYNYTYLMQVHKYLNSIQALKLFY